MVDSAASLPETAPRRDPNPGGRKRPGPGRRRKHPEPHPRGRPVVNPPSIDVVGAASPVEEAKTDTESNAHAVYSTGAGGAEMYHYDRRPSANEQRANDLGQAEVAQVKGPGSP